MFLSDIPRALLRRWYVVLLGLILTADLGFLALRSAPPDYTIVAESLLLPPASSVPQGGNPYLSLGGLNAVGDILSRAMTDTPAVDAMHKAGLTGEFTLLRDANSAAPMMLLTVTANSNDAAVQATDIVLNQIPVTLKTIQSAALVPGDSFITSAVVVHPDHATASNKGQIRVLLVAIVAGLALSVLMTAVVDALLSRSQGKNLRRRKSEPAAPVSPTSERQASSGGDVEDIVLDVRTARKTLDGPVPAASAITASLAGPATPIGHESRSVPATSHPEVTYPRRPVGTSTARTLEVTVAQSDTSPVETKAERTTEVAPSRSGRSRQGRTGHEQETELVGRGERG